MHWAGATVIFQQYIHSLRATTEEWSTQYLPSVWPEAMISYKRSMPLSLAVLHICHRYATANRIATGAFLCLRKWEYPRL